MDQKHGMLSVESENIFPIIKKWLYTEPDVFVRELISNGSDAISKRKMLYDMQETDTFEEGKILLEIDQRAGTLTFIDNGLGMDAEEVDQYINQIAFSGATDFMNRYQEQAASEPIIGHFGLGFYSAFMVADRVTIHSQSYKRTASPVFWECNGDMGYSLKSCQKDEVGTKITLYLAPGSKYLQPASLEAIVKMYFEFYPIPITIACLPETDTKQPPYGVRTINESNPLWCKKPEDCHRQEYVSFYKAAFQTEAEPKAWVHLYDEALGVKGIVYFRSRESLAQSVDGTMKLYSNQVFVSSAAKGLIPEFLFLQDGLIDCRDVPLIVSRSALQHDERVATLTRFITEQIAFKLYGMFTCERELYEEIWEDLNPFVKFSCLKDKLFGSYMEKFILFQNLAKRYVTLSEHLEQKQGAPETVIYYISDEVQQSLYIDIFCEAGVDALYMTHVVDQAYIKKQEMKHQDLIFNRIDSDFYKALKRETTEAEESKLNLQEKELQALFAPMLSEKRMKLRLGVLSTKKVSAIIIVDEEERRIKEILDLYEAKGIDTSKLVAEDYQLNGDTLFLNRENELVCFLLSPGRDADKQLLGRQMFDLARLGQESLEAGEMTAFIERSNEVLKNCFLKTHFQTTLRQGKVTRWRKRKLS